VDELDSTTRCRVSQRRTRRRGKLCVSLSPLRETAGLRRRVVCVEPGLRENPFGLRFPRSFSARRGRADVRDRLELTSAATSRWRRRAASHAAIFVHFRGRVGARVGAAVLARRLVRVAARVSAGGRTDATSVRIIPDGSRWARCCSGSRPTRTWRLVLRGRARRSDPRAQRGAIAFVGRVREGAGRSRCGRDLRSGALDVFGDRRRTARRSASDLFARRLLERAGVFAANYLKHFSWSYLVATGDPQPGVTWRYLVGSARSIGG